MSEVRYWLLTDENGNRPKINRPDGSYAVVFLTRLEAFCAGGSGMSVADFGHDAFVRMCNDPEQPFVGIYIEGRGKYERLRLTAAPPSPHQ